MQTYNTRGTLHLTCCNNRVHARCAQVYLLSTTAPSCMLCRAPIDAPTVTKCLSNCPEHVVRASIEAAFVAEIMRRTQERLDLLAAQRMFNRETHA